MTSTDPMESQPVPGRDPNPDLVTTEPIGLDLPSVQSWVRDSCGYTDARKDVAADLAVHGRQWAITAGPVHTRQRDKRLAVRACAAYIQQQAPRPPAPVGFIFMALLWPILFKILVTIVATLIVNWLQRNHTASAMLAQAPS